MKWWINLVSWSLVGVRSPIRRVDQRLGKKIERYVFINVSLLFNYSLKNSLVLFSGFFTGASMEM